MNALGLIESNSIAKGVEIADVMVKTAQVDILVAKSICPGKYIVLVNGDVAAVKQSVETGLALEPQVVVDYFVIANIHPAILPAISGGIEVGDIQAIGSFETYSVASTIESADLAVKAANVTPLKMHLAFGIGGKSYVVFAGDVADVQKAIEIGADLAEQKGLLTNKIVIPRPHQQVIQSLLS